MHNHKSAAREFRKPECDKAILIGEHVVHVGEEPMIAGSAEAVAPFCHYGRVELIARARRPAAISNGSRRSSCESY